PLQQCTLSPLHNDDISTQSRCTHPRTATARCSPRRARCSIARNPYPFSSPSYSSSIPLFPVVDACGVEEGLSSTGVVGRLV
ncbi:hypothetical protein S245_056095, partial [Arachis hypogaea]